MPIVPSRWKYEWPKFVGERTDRIWGKIYEYEYRGYKGDVYQDKTASGYAGEKNRWWNAEFKNESVPEDYDLIVDWSPTRKCALCSVKLAIDRTLWIVYGAGERGVFPSHYDRDRVIHSRWEIVYGLWHVLDDVDEQGRTIDRASVAREFNRQCERARTWNRKHGTTRGLSESTGQRVRMQPCDWFDNLPLSTRTELIDLMVDAAWCGGDSFRETKVRPTRGSFAEREFRTRPVWGIRRNPRRRRFAVVNDWRRARMGTV